MMYDQLMWVSPDYHCHQSFDQPTSVCVAARAGNEGRLAEHGRRAGAREETWSGLAMAGYALGVGIFALSGLTFMVLAGLAGVIYFKPHLRVRSRVRASCVSCVVCRVSCVVCRVS
jgi:hypothetical protein